ncbi:MAG TPA: CHASE3 domain-containing protein, partial [Duganella sp.]|uniref:CHASE3 domain-containing protein n=1 Tax=Duganella sp. TaxID=1904440 RepID=UPI002ED1A5E7
MLKDLSIKTKLGAGFAAIVAIILVLLTLAYTNFSKLSAANAWDRHTLQVLLEANRIETALVQIQTSTRGFMLTGEESLTAPIAAEEALARRHQTTIATLTADNPEQQQRLKRLAPLIDTWIERVIHPLLDKRRALNKQVGVSQQVATPADVLNGAKTITEARALLGEISAEESRLLEQRAAASAELQHSMSLLLILGGSACVVLAAVVGYLLSQALLGPLNHLTAAVGRITGGDQSARAAVLSGDELGRVGTAFNHMAQTIQDSQANEQAATNLLKAKVDALLGVVSKAASGDLTGRIEVSGADAIGQLAHGLARMFDNLRALLNDVQKAGIQVTTAATQIAASAKQQEATGIEQAQTSVEILSTTREISANTAELLRTMEDATAVADYTTSATA